jgi:hypothetical protein
LNRRAATAAERDGEGVALVTSWVAF